jgi:ABC-type uncharacterized transport system substrate-binding protein
MDNEVLQTRKLGVAYWVVTSLAMGLLAVLFMAGKAGQGPLAGIVDLTTQPVSASPARQFRVLHVMSYHLPWEWTESQLNGFREAMRGVNVDYRVIQMDAKRHSEEQSKLKVAEQARREIETWQPDLIFTGDDDAQSYVARYYVNKKVPVVFAAVNADPSVYGFTGSKNVTGVLEHIHFVQSIELLTHVAPGVRRIAVISDTGTMWPPIMDTMRQNEDRLPANVRITDYHVLSTFEDYKRTVRDCQQSADALCFLGVFEFKDATGANVPLETVQKWTVANSRLPDVSFWRDRVDKGTLCAATVSGYAQGYEAGKMARGILTECRSPDSYPFATTETGVPVINTARAEKLGLKPDSQVLVASQVVRWLPR